jgi:hypothetical protein
MTVTESAALAVIPDVHLSLVMTAADTIMHGAGNAGNTQLLRTQEMLLPDGTQVRVPYVSGNSVRHQLRDALAWHLVQVLDVEPGSLPKGVTDLLWSGGALTETGSRADLAMMRRVHDLLPGLGLLGYSARSAIITGTLHASNVHVTCAENAWRLPAALREHPHAALPAGAARSETFGTRHDIAGTPAARYIALLDGQPQETSQMIYDAQVITAGAVLWGSLHLGAPAAGHAEALACAVTRAWPLEGGMRRVTLGGRRSAGHGVCLLGPGCLEPLGDLDAMAAAYEDRLVSRREEALALLREVTGT